MWFNEPILLAAKASCAHFKISINSDALCKCLLIWIRHFLLFRSLDTLKKRIWETERERKRELKKIARNGWYCFSFLMIREMKINDCIWIAFGFLRTIPTSRERGKFFVLRINVSWKTPTNECGLWTWHKKWKTSKTIKYLAAFSSCN